MREGIAYRVEKINEFIVDHSGELDTNAVAQMIIDKMLDESDLMSVYVIYLQTKKNNQKLKNLFPILVEESLKAAYTGIKGAKESDCSLKGFLGNIFPKSFSLVKYPVCSNPSISGTLVSAPAAIKILSAAISSDRLPSVIEIGRASCRERV